MPANEDTMRHHRSGSAILLCLALAAIAVMIGFAFLRIVSRQDISGTSEMLDGLARDAARSGLAHATEQIMADYNATSLPMAIGSGASAVPTSAVVAPIPTHLDGPYRAPFASLALPGRLLTVYNMSPSTNGTDDAQQENNVLMPFIKKDSDGAGARIAEAWYCDRALMIYDGRGRYYEPGYHDITRPNPAVAAPVPVTAVRFTDPAATASDRNAPLFLDRSLHRLTGTSTTERTKARYRVRYAVGVEDLQGHLLSNPRADMDVDWTNASNDYRSLPPWLNTAAYAWNAMNGGFFTLTYGYDAGGVLNTWFPTVPLRLDHIFRGRGSASNADRAWAVGATQGQPAAFPYMFRAAGRERNPFTGGFYPGTTGYDQWWGNHTWDGNYADGSIYDGVYDGTAIPVNQENLGGRLYRFVGNPGAKYPAIAPDPAGGQILTPVAGSPHPYVHALVGPQLSWYNQLACVQGYLPDYHRYGEAQDGRVPTSNTIGVITSPQSYYLTNHALFGRRMESSASGTANPKWYQGAVDTPWLVNALTATPQTIHMMLLAYMPPYLKTIKYDRDEYYKKIDEVPYTDGDGNLQIEEVYDTTIDHITLGPWFYQIRGLEVLNDQLGSGFADFPAPSSVDAGFTIKPDYYQDDPEPRPVENRYPGPLCRGDSTIANQGLDDLGQYIDADSRGIGYCSHTGRQLLWLAAYDQWRTQEEGFLEGGKTWNRKWKIRRRLDPLTYKYRYSYFWDLSLAMTQALAFARATWVQYPNHCFDPATDFTPRSLRDPRNYDTVEELDRLLLRQLGENFDNPGTPCADNPILMPLTGTADAWVVPKFSFTLATTKPPHTIASMRTTALLQTASGVLSPERAKVMERMLNDFRLSFLGVSPAYRNTFQPLDFDGDHHVHCSAYDINAAATPNEVAYKTARWKTDDGAGRGPVPSALTTPGTDYTTGFSNNPWFCATGAFFIGKSHYYRVFVRGEVYDNLLNKPVTTRTLESVMAVDPEATIDPHDPSRPGANRPYTETLFQRWHYNDQTSELPRHVR